MPTPSRIAPILVLALVLPPLAGCGGDPGARLPEGWTLAGHGARLAPTLERLRALERTPLAEQAAKLGARIADCELFVAHCAVDPDTEAVAPACRLAETVECVDELPDWVDDAGTTDGIGDDGAPVDWALAHRTADGPWLVLRARGHGDGSLDVAGEAGPVGLGGAVSLLLPAAEPAGPVRLTDDEALIHLRVRPDGGLNLARFVEGEGWGARMYRLRSDLFEGKALAGVWELAVYEPLDDELIPPAVLAVDVEEGERELAIEAMEQFLDELQEVWPVRRSDYELGGDPGACLGNVRVMPNLSPCYVATPEALVIGWNPRSLELALAPRRDSGPSADASGGTIHFSRFPAADRVVASTSGAPSPVPPSFYPWSLLELSGRREDDAYVLRARLGVRKERPR